MLPLLDQPLQAVPLITLAMQCLVNARTGVFSPGKTPLGTLLIEACSWKHKRTSNTTIIMLKHQEISIYSKVLSAYELARHVESFAASHVDWSFPSEQSRRYEELCGAPSCCMVSNMDAMPKAAVHLSAEGEKKLRLAAIVPLMDRELGVEECNQVLVVFAKHFRKAIRESALSIRVSLSKPTLSLKDVIGGKLANKRFQQYVGAYPHSGHPADTRRLDKFICTLSSFSRKPFDAGAFQALLSKEPGWTSEQAKQCRDRVEIGLEVLEVYKRF
jgi:hypothetical protein